MCMDWPSIEITPKHMNAFRSNKKRTEMLKTRSILENESPTPGKLLRCKMWLSLKSEIELESPWTAISN